MKGEPSIAMLRRPSGSCGGAPEAGEGGGDRFPAKRREKRGRGRAQTVVVLGRPWQSDGGGERKRRVRARPPRGRT